MRRVAVVMFVGFVALAGWACRQGAVQAVKASPVERGEYLVTAMACNDCHTPWKLGMKGPEPDMTRMLSGHPEGVQVGPAPSLAPPWGLAGSLTNTAWAGPWGVSFSANLTSDPETGVGAWDEATFIAAMRSGQHLGGGRPILPPMPWPFTGKLTDEDLKAVFAYLKSTPPIRNKVPEPLPPSAPPSQ